MLFSHPCDMKNKTNRQLSSKTYAGCGRNEGEDSADDDESDGNRPQDADDVKKRDNSTNI